ncbi:MAG: Na+/H+ antiporter NhaC family protein [Bacteroidales bacterium]|nr:Na+/H+ antiporter NhaC family protein [Bacteroidales bacterium]
MKNKISNAQGLRAISPLVVFLLVYLVSSVVAGDFYKVPVTTAFLISSVYSILICKGEDLSIDKRISIFSEGVSDKNVLLMIWIFILAGAFASSAKAIGSVEATVNLTLVLLPAKLIFAGLFLAACFISMAVGTSVGTVVALVPIAAGIAQDTGMSVPMITAIIVGGAFFGDNLSFISDTTIAATKTQGCAMSDKFKVNIWLAAPAAIIVATIYVIMGLKNGSAPDAQLSSWFLAIPYLLIIVLAVCGVNVLAVLAIGTLLNAVIGFVMGSFDWFGFLASVGDGILGMAELIIVTMLAAGMLSIIRYCGGLEYIIESLTRHIRGKRGAEFVIAALVALSNLCTANNTIAIITTGGIAKDISDKFSLDPRKSASIMDTFSCLVQSLIPYGAQMLMASGLAGVSALSIIGYMYYPFVLGAIAILAILLRLPRRYS